MVNIYIYSVSLGLTSHHNEYSQSLSDRSIVGNQFGLWSKSAYRLICCIFISHLKKQERTPSIARTLLTFRSNEAKQTRRTLLCVDAEDAPVWESHHHHNGWHAATTLLYSYGRAFGIQYELCMRFTMMSASHETLLMRLLLRFMRVRLQWMLRNAQKFGITRFCTLLTIARHTCRRVCAGRAPNSMRSMHFILPLDLSSINYVCGQWSLNSIFILV